jgi:hypothetical protein
MFNDDHDEFTRNMRVAKIKTETYNRRFGDDRPAARAADPIELQRIIRATPVILEWDTLGMGWIVYPAVRAER